MVIFLKIVDEAVSEKQLSVEIAKAKSVQIEGSSAEKIVENLEELLEEKDSLILIAGANIFSNRLEEKEINDSAYCYQIHQSSPEQKDFEIYCQSGTSIEIKRICSI